MQLLEQNATVDVANEDLNNEALPLQKPILEQSESEFCASWGPCNALAISCDDFVHRFGFEPSEKGVKEMKQALQAGNSSRKDFTCTLRLETPVPRYQRREYVLPV